MNKTVTEEINVVDAIILVIRRVVLGSLAGFAIASAIGYVEDRAFDRLIKRERIMTNLNR